MPTLLTLFSSFVFYIHMLFLYLGWGNVIDIINVEKTFSHFSQYTYMGNWKLVIQLFLGSAEYWSMDNLL